MNFPKRAESRLHLRQNRRDIVVNRYTRIYCTQVWRLLKRLMQFLLLSVVLSFIISVLAFDYVSTKYDTLQVKQEDLESSILFTITSGKGIDGELIPFNISYYDSDIVKLGKSNTEYVNIRFRVLQDRFPADSLQAKIDGETFDNLNDIHFLTQVKREEPIKKYLFIELKSTQERVGYAQLDLNKNFTRSVQARIEVEAKSKFSRFIHSITTRISD